MVAGFFSSCCCVISRLSRSRLSLFDPNIFRTKAFVTLRGVERNRLIFPQLLEHLAMNRAPMDEVLLTVIAPDESESLVTDQPRNLAVHQLPPSLLFDVLDLRPIPDDQPFTISRKSSRVPH